MANVMKSVLVSPTGMSTSIYASGDVMGVLMTIPSPFPVNAGFGYVSKAVVHDVSKQSAHIQIALFDTTLTPAADNAAFAPTAAVMKTCIALLDIPAAAYSAFSVTSAAMVAFSPKVALKLTSRSIFALVVSYGTPTLAVATDLTYRLTFEYEA